MLLLTSRPAGTSVSTSELPGDEVVLAELTASESLAMVREALGVADLPAEVGEAIYAKTKGNPLFLEEVIHSLQAPGVLDRILGASSVARAAEMAALEIPDRVQGLLMSRIDRLPPDTREVLKAGSVVGRSFDQQRWRGSTIAPARPIAARPRLDELVAAALVVRGDDGRRRLRSTFRHALVQDVPTRACRSRAGGSCTAASRATSRRRQAIPDHGLLVHHYRLRGDRGKTRLHAVRASESSVAVYANREAIDYLPSRSTPRRAGPHAMPACAAGSRSSWATASSPWPARRGGGPLLAGPPALGLARCQAAAEHALRELAPIDDVEGRDSLLCWKIAVAVERGRVGVRPRASLARQGRAALRREPAGLTARMLITRVRLPLPARSFP